MKLTKKQIKMNLQRFATEANQTQAADLGDIKSVDFVNRFSFSIQELLDVLGITRKLPLVQNQKIITYKFTTTRPATKAAEGEDIPLTKVEKKKDKEYTIPFNKERKVATAEAILAHGADVAINDTDNEVLGTLQLAVKADFFTYLAAAPTKQEAATLQKAISKGWAKARQFFKNKGNVSYISFVNPMDVAEFLGDAQVSAVTSTQYGFTLLTNFVNQNVVVFDDVPEGKVYTTAVENLVFAYYDVAKGDLGSQLNLTLDDSGLIGVVHTPNTKNASVETLALSGSTLFAEISDGVVETSIIVPAAGTGE